MQGMEAVIKRHQAGVHNVEVITFPAHNPAAGGHHSIRNNPKILCSTETWLRWGPYMLTLHSHNTTPSLEDLPVYCTHKRFVAEEQAASEPSYSGTVISGSNCGMDALFRQLATQLAEGGEGNGGRPGKQPAACRAGAAARSRHMSPHQRSRPPQSRCCAGLQPPVSSTQAPACIGPAFPSQTEGILR